MKRAKTVAFISEHTKSFTAAMRDGAVATAEDLGLKIVANIGIKSVACATGETCSKPGRDTLTKLIPAGGNVLSHRLRVRRLLMRAAMLKGRGQRVVSSFCLSGMFWM